MYEELKEGVYENSFCMKEDYLLEEANSENSDAMYLLATLYYDDGQMTDAYKWFCKAVEKSQADATYYIGKFYWHPTGYGIVEPSNEKAIELLKKAEELVNHRVFIELAHCYEYGIGVEKDFEKALKYTQKAYQALGEENL